MQNGNHVVIVARHGPSDRDILYTSPWAGAHYRPIPDIDHVSRLEADFTRVSYEVMKQIAETHPSSGVKMVDGFEYIDNPSEAYTELKGRYSQIEGFRVLEKNELPAGVEFGSTYKTWCVNAPVYLAWLERQLVVSGVQIIQHTLTSIAEVFPLVNDPDIHTVINCTGIGFSDPDVFPTRGNIVFVRSR